MLEGSESILVSVTTYDGSKHIVLIHKQKKDWIGDVEAWLERENEEVVYRHTGETNEEILDTVVNWSFQYHVKDFDHSTIENELIGHRMGFEGYDDSFKYAITEIGNKIEIKIKDSEDQGSYDHLINENEIEQWCMKERMK